MESLELLVNAYGKLDICTYENQNRKYEGIIFQTIEDRRIIRSRLCKKTPKKSGYFVAFWEKELSNNRPFLAPNSPNELAIVVIDGLNKGLFSLPKEAAITHRILTDGNQIGKMGMRFYPPWCKELNHAAMLTQKWQLNFFKSYS